MNWTMNKYEIDALKVGSYIAREPAGYSCEVIAVERVAPGCYPKRVRVKDIHSRGRVYWISWNTLAAKWRVPGGI